MNTAKQNPAPPPADDSGEEHKVQLVRVVNDKDKSDRETLEENLPYALKHLPAELDREIRKARGEVDESSLPSFNDTTYKEDSHGWKE